MGNDGHELPAAHPSVPGKTHQETVPAIACRGSGNDTGPKEHVETSVAAVAEMLCSAKVGIHHGYLG